jgi:Zn-dependent protease with chaperone function
MGHIKASHLRLRLLIDQLARTLSRSPIIPDELAVLPLLPALKWAREAEMSADNAGLLCAQDLGAAERALMRLLLNLDEETIGAVNVDKYLAQKEGLGLSGISEAWFYLRQLSRSHPFVPDRIRQLREYRRERYDAVMPG